MKLILFYNSGSVIFAAHTHGRALKKYFFLKKLQVCVEMASSYISNDCRLFDRVSEELLFTKYSLRSAFKVSLAFFSLLPIRS